MAPCPSAAIVEDDGIKIAPLNRFFYSGDGRLRLNHAHFGQDLDLRYRSVRVREDLRRRREVLDAMVQPSLATCAPCVESTPASSHANRIELAPNFSPNIQ